MNFFGIWWVSPFKTFFYCEDKLLGNHRFFKFMYIRCNFVNFFGGQGLLLFDFFWWPKPFYIFFVLYVCTNKGKITQGGNPVVLPYGAEVPVLPGPPVGHHEGCHTAHQVVDCRGLEVQLPIHDPSGWVYPN